MNDLAGCVVPFQISVTTDAVVLAAAVKFSVTI